MERVRGILPSRQDASSIALHPRIMDTLNAEKCFELTPASDSWKMGAITEFHVMLKTLQQARVQGIWEPCLAYYYKWGNEVYISPRGSPIDMRWALDVGVYTIAEDQRPARKEWYGTS